MNSTEEIVRKYDKKRAILRKLQYVEQIAIPLFFYSAFRFYDQITPVFEQPLSIFSLVVITTFSIGIAKTVYLWSVYGLGTNGIGKKPSPLKWWIIVTGILTGLAILEATSFLI